MKNIITKVASKRYVHLDKYELMYFKFFNIHYKYLDNKLIKEF